VLTLRRSAHVTAPILGSASEKAEAVLKAYDYTDIELQAESGRLVGGGGIEFMPRLHTT